jgi:hypothetical protein
MPEPGAVSETRFCAALLVFPGGAGSPVNPPANK